MTRKYKINKTILKIKKLSNKCFVCGFMPGFMPSVKSNELTYDHIIPRSKGGTNIELNIMIICENCNTRKGNKNPLKWFNSLPEKLKTKELEDKIKTAIEYFMRLKLEINTWFTPCKFS